MKSVKKGSRINKHGNSNRHRSKLPGRSTQIRQTSIGGFLATWCGPCKIVKPVVEKLAEEYKDKVKVVEVDVDQNQQVSGQFGIMSIPTLMFFKNGQPVKSMIGAQGEEALRHEFDAVSA